MTDSTHGSMFDGLRRKAEEAVDKFMADPAKVEGAKTKADDILGRYVDRQTAEKVTDTAEKALRSFTNHTQRD